MGNFQQQNLSIEQMIGISSQSPTQQQIAISTFKNYYFGHQNVVHSDRQNTYLTDPADSTFPNSFINVSQIVVDILSNRLSIEPDGAGIKPLDDQSNLFAEYLSNIWVQTDLNSVQNSIHKLVLRDGAAALQIDWIDGKPEFTPQEIYDGSTGVFFFMSEVNKDEYLFVTKTWEVLLYDTNGEQSDSVLRMNLYLPGEIYRYWSQDGTEWLLLDPEQVANETLEEETENPQILPLPIIPLVLFENEPKVSEVADVYKLQLLMNKYGGDIDIMTDYYASPLLTAESGLEETTLAGPGRGINGVNVRRLDPPSLDKVWDGSVLKWIDILSMVKSLPLWILNPRGFVVPSGTALRVAERPLTAQIVQKQNGLDKSWKRTFDLVRQMENQLGELEFSQEDKIRITWISPNTESVIEDRQIEVDTAVKAQIPYRTIWEQVYGFDENQIEEMEAELQESLRYKKQQAELIQILTSSLVDPANAALFANVPQEEALQLIENVLNEGINESGTINTSIPTNNNQGNLPPILPS